MRTLEIEWKHLDKEGNTCILCLDTGEELNQLIGNLANECRLCGWDIKFKETKLSEVDA